MKPLTHKDAILKEKFVELDDWIGIEDRLVRENKRIWKKVRTKYLRNFMKEELKEICNELRVD